MRIMCIFLLIGADRGQQAKSSEDQGGEGASEGASGARPTHRARSADCRGTTGAGHEHRRSAVSRGAANTASRALHSARPATEPARGGTLFGELLG